MFYVYKNKSGGWSISVEPPKGVEYHEFDSIPDGDGAVYYRDGKLYREPIPKAQEPLDEPIEVKLLKAQLKAQTERSDFLEDCIAEMATVVYGGV